MARPKRPEASVVPEGEPLAPIPEPLLDVDEIQGNILAGFSKDHQHLLALKIGDVAAARRWLGRILPYISSLAEVVAFNELFKMRKARLGHDPGGLVATWANIAFSRDGLAALTSPHEADSLPDAAFRLGLPARSPGLGDPIAAGEHDPTKGWVVGGTGRVPDIFLIVAGDDPSWLATKVATIRPGPSDGPGAPEVIWDELGATRPDLPGHEHFGFKDGVSQPGVRGLVSTSAGGFLTRRVLEPAPDGEVSFAIPGRSCADPGPVTARPGLSGPSRKTRRRAGPGGGSLRRPGPATARSSCSAGSTRTSRASPDSSDPRPRRWPPSPAFPG